MNTIPKFLCVTLAAVAFAVAEPAHAALDGSVSSRYEGYAVHGFSEPPTDSLGAVQRGCMSLSEAVESVRQRGNVDRVISAETTVSNGREIHVIKVLTTDGKVRTHRVQGCER